MNENSNLIIQNMYNTINDELIILFNEISGNEKTITELTTFISSLKDASFLDQDPFNPRFSESLHASEIRKCNNRIVFLEDENSELFKIVDIKKKYLKQLDCILAEEQVAINSTTNKINNNNVHILELQEIERQRIARDLHDVSLQNLTHITHKLEIASIYMEKDIIEAKLELASAKNEIKNIISEIRNIIFDLRPMTFDDLGLSELFANYFTNLRHECNFTINTDIDHIIVNNEIIRISLYRIVHEACSNAINHSGGDLLSVSLKATDNCYRLIISDNGVGLPEDISNGKKHYGLQIMKERTSILNGTYNIDSGSNGTVITVDIPKNSIEE